MSGITIPPAALEAGARAIDCRVSEPGQCSYHDMARAAFLAILENWPGMDVADEYDLCAIRKGWITLPQENSDA